MTTVVSVLTRPASGVTGAGGLPAPRGPLTKWLFGVLAGHPAGSAPPAVISADPLRDDDLQLALYCCYELLYRGFDGVSDDWEWDPSVIQLRLQLEAAFEGHLGAALPDGHLPARGVPEALWAMTGGDGFSLSSWLGEHGDLFHARELAVHRSGYQLKEADPHTWGIPRLSGRAKAAMVAIQVDEYGGGVTDAMHAVLFADAMVALDLDPGYGFYLDALPAVTLATTNLISMFGLHRRLRGALVGHLAGFEMNSVGPMGRYDRWLATLGISERGRQFYRVHVEADAVHQHVAVDDLVGGLLADEPDQADAVLFGARALGLVEGAFAGHLAHAWKSGRTSLRAGDDWAPTPRDEPATWS